MANKTNKLTAAQALTIFAKVAQSSPDAFAAALAEVNKDATTAQLASKADHMAQQAGKIASRPKTPTKASIENTKYAKQVEDFLTANPDTIVSPKWVVAHVQYVDSTQKAAAVLNVLLKSGKVERVDTNGHGVAYKLAGDGKLAA